MIKYKEDGYLDLKAMNKVEKKVFIQFLKHEKNRHLEDIAFINRSIKEIEGLLE